MRRELERGARRSAAAVKSEEEEAKVHFCDDVAAIKRRRASELAAVCGGGAVGVKSLYRSRAVERDTIDCEHGLRAPQRGNSLHFTPTPKFLGTAESYFLLSSTLAQFFR